MSTERRSMCEVNELHFEDFIAVLGNVVEHSPQCTSVVWSSRPFRDVDHLQASFEDVLDGFPPSGKEGILRQYGDLSVRLALFNQLTSESKREREAAGLDRITEDDRERLTDLTALYRGKYGVPFVICSRKNSLDTIFGSLARRLENTKTEEIVTGINEVKKICNLRIRDLVVDATSTKHRNIAHAYTCNLHN